MIAPILLVIYARDCFAVGVFYRHNFNYVDFNTSFMPIILDLGIDLIWFCILILVQLELAGITPPFGVLLFVMKGVQQHLQMSEIYRAAVPVVLIQIFLVMMLMIFPEIVTTLPELIRK